MRSLSNLLVLLLTGLALSGCATVLTGTHDEVTIRSEPEGAIVYVDGLEEGQTPATIDIKRPGISKTEITVRLDGYEPQTFVLRKEFNAVSVINLTNPLFWAIDVATGAVTKYKPEGYDIELVPENQAYHEAQYPDPRHGNWYIRPDREYLLEYQATVIGHQ